MVWFRGGDLRENSIAVVRAACRVYLQIVDPFYAYFGLALCRHFASQGAGRMLWPVIASMVRVIVIVIGCVVLFRSQSARPSNSSG